MRNPEKVRHCPECSQPTRPSRTTVADYPGTSRRYGEKCANCHRADLRAASAGHAESITYTIAGLESFLARRRDRENAMFRRELITTYPHLVREQVTA